VAGKGGSVLGGVFVMVQSIIGGGLLAYPAGYKLGGFGGMLVMQALMMLFIAAGLRMLAYLTDYTNKDTYQAVVEKLLGARMHKFSSACILLNIFGANVCYLIISADQIVSVMEYGIGCGPDHSHNCPWYAGRIPISVAVTSIAFALCLVKNISKLAFASFLGFGSMIYVTIVVALHYTSLDTTAADYIPPHCDTFKSSPLSWFSVLPTVCFGFQGHISAVPLYYEMQNRTQKKFDVVILCALVSFHV
jgi:sodium-coupled neutral amino acid transporter 7/8